MPRPLDPAATSHSPRTSVRFVAAEFAALTTLAAERGQTRSELIREAIAVGVATLKEAPPPAP